jgi:uncharacterized protein YjiS (DUF1127 family)/predicted RNase H-like HicB family nuclease
MRVEVTREGRDWLADVPEVEGTHTYARTLTGLDREVREAIAVGLDLDDDYQGDLEWDFRGAPAQLARAAETARRRREAREQLDALTDESARQTRELVSAGLSTRDVARVVDLTPGRVSQIVKAGR